MRVGAVSQAHQPAHSSNGVSHERNLKKNNEDRKKVTRRSLNIRSARFRHLRDEGNNLFRSLSGHRVISVQSCTKRGLI